MTFSIIQKSQLEGALRLDAEYYQPEFLSAKINLLARRHWVLGDHSFITDGEHGSVDFVEKGVKYLTAENVKEGFLNLKNVRSVSSEVDMRNKRASLKTDDIALSIKGTVGIASIVRPQDLPANMNRDVSRINIKDTISPYYLLAFLNSKYGKNQTLREGSGNVQQMITLQRIRELIIPESNIDFQNSIESIYVEADNQRTISANHYQQAEEILLKELGLENFGTEKKLFSIVNLSDCQKANRIDAEYFQPKFAELISIINSTKPKKLGELVSVTKGFEPGSEAYQENGVPFIRVSSLSKDGIDINDQKYLKDALFQKLKQNFQPKVGEVLLTKDASPGIAYTVKEPIDGIISGGILRLKLKIGVEPEYLALCLNSIVGKMQADRDAGGSIISHWKPDQIKEILIPILPKETQEKIADLVRKSHAALQKSQALLAEAKRKVEELIEKGGE